MAATPRTLLARYLPDFCFVLDDLAAIDIARLVARTDSPLVTLALFALKRARHTNDLLGELRSIARQFAALEHARVPREQIAAALSSSSVPSPLTSRAQFKPPPSRNSTAGSSGSCPRSARKTSCVRR